MTSTRSSERSISDLVRIVLVGIVRAHPGIDDQKLMGYTRDTLGSQYGTPWDLDTYLRVLRAESMPDKPNRTIEIKFDGSRQQNYLYRPPTPLDST